MEPPHTPDPATPPSPDQSGEKGQIAAPCRETESSDSLPFDKIGIFQTPGLHSNSHLLLRGSRVELVCTFSYREEGVKWFILEDMVVSKLSQIGDLMFKLVVC